MHTTFSVTLLALGSTLAVLASKGSTLEIVGFALLMFGLVGLILLALVPTAYTTFGRPGEHADHGFTRRR
jgi:hypothetical protein